MYYKLKAPRVPEFEASGMRIPLSPKIERMEGFRKEDEEAFKLEDWKAYLWAEALTSEGKKYGWKVIQELATVLKETVTVPYRIWGLTDDQKTELHKALNHSEQKQTSEAFENLLSRKAAIWNELMNIRVQDAAARARRIHARRLRALVAAHRRHNMPRVRPHPPQ